MNKLRTTTKLHAHRVQLDLQIFHPSHLYHAYSLLPRKALGKRHLVFLDLEFSKKHENNYQDCPTCDSCLPNAFNERHLINGKYGINKSFCTANGLNSGESTEMFKLSLNNFANPYRLFTTMLLQIESNDDWSKKKNELQKNSSSPPLPIPRQGLKFIGDLFEF